ncbi:TetR/AcrR family transcriptional regulator [Baekduia sp.]|jgi:AcrR family transcriptional regulator|uniref:TetR/AcrR family transcriptional regulator n=1 Tax=Baekduia sp. TaxID=2600305 RepID=UPI002E048ED3|nr:TetR/AcrR family transcriptional regulator [Baekduia sp.]
MDHLDLAGTGFAPRDEREELMMVFASIVYEHGYRATRLSDVADRAGVSLATLTGCWPTEIDWLLETAAASARQLYGRMADASASVQNDPARAVHHALSTMLCDLAAAPEMVYLSVIELPALGPLIHARQRHTLTRFSTFLDPGPAAPNRSPSQRQTTALCLAGGLWETIHSHALDRRLHELPDRLPAISHVCLSTVFGIQEARRVNSLAYHPA